MDETKEDAPRWDDLAAFLTIARTGGLSAAARELGSSAPTLGRRMLALERVLGRDLFTRRSHGYALTGEGERLRDELAPLAERLQRITARPAARALPVVKITAGTWTMWSLARSVQTLSGSPADVLLQLDSGEAVRSIAHREAAIGFRNRRPTEAGLAARKLRRVEFVPYAVPDAPAGWIAVAADTPSARWVSDHAGAQIACRVSAPRMAFDLALAGIGRCVLPTFVGDAHPQLQRCGAPIEELAHESWLVTHVDDRHLPEIRRVLDRIADLDRVSG